MPYLLNLVYLVLLVVVSPVLISRAIWQGKYRRGLATRLLGRLPRRTGTQPCCWLHAVSVGEVNLLEPLLAELEQQHPDWQFVISSTTRTGFELAVKKYAPRQVFYSPLDFSWAVRAVLKRVRPDLILLVELELWPNLIQLAARQGIPLGVVNGRLSESSARGYGRLRPVVAGMLKRLSLIAVQNETYANRFLKLGACPQQVQVTGSMKFDGAISDRNNEQTRQLAELAGIQPADAVLLAGSTQVEEEQLALEAFLQLKDRHPQLRLILVPRHPERFAEVSAMLDRSGLQWQRRSELSQLEGEADCRVLLVDAVGELQAWWGTAQIALVGGSFGSRGGQNMIEPAAYGAAVSFGPNTRNFRDVVQLLLDAEAARVIHDQQEFTSWVEQCLADPQQAAAMGQRACQLVAEQQGATARTVELIEQILN